MSTIAIPTANGSRTIAHTGDPASGIQDKLAHIRHLSYAAIRAIVAATKHAEQSVELLPCDPVEIASAHDALDQAVHLLADAAGWLAILTPSPAPMGTAPGDTKPERRY